MVSALCSSPPIPFSISAGIASSLSRQSDGSQFREFAVAGGVLSYGQSFVEIYRQNGLYAVNILKGAKPSDLPVQQVDKFELIINVKAAKAQGIAISDNLLSLADEIIE